MAKAVKVSDKMASTTNENLSKMGSTLATNAPHWLVLLALVAAFLFYMERSDLRDMERMTRGDLVAQQRITTCHDVQERSIKVMDNLNTTLGKHGETLDNLREEVERIGRALDRGLKMVNSIELNDPCK